MKQRKRRKSKKAVEFFCLHGNFREPYQVILDGNFLHIALTSGIEDLRNRIGDLLNSGPKKPPKLFTTRCVLKELQSLGFQDAWTWASENTFPQSCSHLPCVTPSECILSIASASARGYFVATQDGKLHEELGRQLGTAVITLSVNGVHLLGPSQQQQLLAKEATDQDMGVSQQELRKDPEQPSEPVDTHVRPYSKIRQKQLKKLHASRQSELGLSSQTGKKKRPGPRLRNALKAEAAAKALETAKANDQGPAGKSTTLAGESSVVAAAAGPGTIEQSPRKKRKKRRKSLSGSIAAEQE